jgi:hypothetical protein
MFLLQLVLTQCQQVQLGHTLQQLAVVEAVEQLTQQAALALAVVQGLLLKLGLL